ncbi:hypothetical protein [Methylobacterium sp. Leaf111]|uniref:hypothetical protein n=1 Tax=Methylobacterium sp. Leaf111 TaxID=1736257 RepID=UPI0012E820D3|nr:hypothetical protein [Methylobacterium sp. Leaf111]
MEYLGRTDSTALSGRSVRAEAPKDSMDTPDLQSPPAVLLRIVAAPVVFYWRTTPRLRIVGGTPPMIAANLAGGEDEAHPNATESVTRWRAFQTVAGTDLAMNLENVVADAAARKGLPSCSSSAARSRFSSSFREPPRGSRLTAGRSPPIPLR